LHWGSYRSVIGINIKGDADSQNINPCFAELRVFVDTGASANMDLAGLLSGLYQLTDSWSLLGDATQTDWAQFDEVGINFNSPNQPVSVTTDAWDDSYRHSFGVRYQPNVSWTYRLGVAYDETPVADEMHRTSCLSDVIASSWC
jgi:long-chain fatty acid transport protein